MLKAICAWYDPNNTETKSGYKISIGGGIEKGQTPKQAVLAELEQETGLSLKDIKNFKFEKKFITPEETFHVFTGELKEVGKVISCKCSGEFIAVKSRNVINLS